MAKEDGKVAKKYAKALFELCAFGGAETASGGSGANLEAIKVALNSFSQSWENHPELRMTLLNPAVPLDQRLAVVREKAKRLRPGDQVFENFLCTLLENGRLAVVPAISVRFAELVEDFQRILSLQITSAFPLDEGEKNKILGEIRAQVPFEYASLVSIAWNVDRQILGGLLIKAGDKLLDSSVRGSLEQIHRELSSAASKM